jgi:hypothetical protein
MDETRIHHHTKIQTAVKTVGRSRLFSAKEDEVGSISRKGHGNGVLGCLKAFCLLIILKWVKQ